MRRWTIPILIALVVVAALALSTGRFGGRFAEEPVTIDHDYVMALSAADQFLGAWATRDADRGYPLLSDRLKKSMDQERLRLAIAGVSNPHHTAFEVFGGRRLDKDRFRFFAYLFESYTGEPTKPRPRPDVQTITLVRKSGDTWVVDEFPLNPKG